MNRHMLDDAVVTIHDDLTRLCFQHELEFCNEAIHPPYRRDSATSKAAAIAVRPKFSDHMNRYLDLLRTFGRKTDHEAARQLNRPVSGICSTRNELMRHGLVRDSGHTAPSPSSRRRRYARWPH